MIKLFVKKYPAVFSFSILIIVIGVSAYLTLPRESAPEIKQPVIFITTFYQGVAAKDIENLITETIEDELDGMEGLKKITSTSQQSLSSIVAEFTPNTPVEIALRRVRDRVEVAKAELPADVDEPVVKELNFSNQPILIFLLSNPNGLHLLGRTTDFLEEQLKKIKGVLDVNISGKLEKEVAIEINPLKLRHHGLSLTKVIEAIQGENVTIPGGILKSKEKTYTLSVSGELKNPADFEDIVVTDKEIKVKLKSLGTAKLQFKEPETYARINGIPAISISITKRTGENIIRIVKETRKMLNENTFRFPEKTKLHYSFDQSRDIRLMVEDLENNIITGAILVFLVTLFFLGITNALFVSLAIPFSMLLSFFVIQMMGMTLNMIVLFSLLLALGMLVDNGIVVVENIFRHASLGKSRVKAAIDGTNEVALPIIASTATTILAFFPIIFMPGIIGDFMSYLPKTIIIVLSASLVVGISINPVFCSRFLNVTEKMRKQITEGSGRFVKFQNGYTRTLKWALSHPVLVITLSFILVFSGMILNAKFGKETVFFPNLDPLVATIAIEGPQGTPLERTDSLTQFLESQVLGVPNSIQDFQGTAGKGYSADMFGSSGDEFHKANIRLGFVPYRERKIKAKTTVTLLKEKLKWVTGAEIKIHEMEGGPPTGHDVSYEVTGDDYEVLGEISEKVLNILKPYVEFDNYDRDYEPAKPEVKIEIDREKAALYGVNTQKIASTIRNAMAGSPISKFRQGKNEYDINIRFVKKFRNELAALNAIEIFNEGKRIPLSSVAKISSESSVGSIRRKNRKRTVEIYADFKPEVQGKDTVEAQIQAAVSKIKVPQGYFLGKGEGEQVQSEATTFLGQAFLIALFLIFILLVVQFNSIVQPLIILVSIFLSLGGVFWGFFLTQKTFVIIMSGIGTIGLAGVVVNNAIVLIDYTNVLIRKAMPPIEAVIEAGRTRLRPVLLTAITTVFGLLPMALGVAFDIHTFQIQWDSESSVWWKSLAWTIIFGLSFATIMTLIVLPTLLKVYFGFFPPQQIELD